MKLKDAVRLTNTCAPKLSRRLLLLSGVGFAASSAGAQQAWPAGPLRLVVSWPPGGSADSIARIVGERLSPRLGQPIVVDNRPGAGGRIGTLSVVRSDPDGHTLLLGAPSEITIAPATVRDLQYDPLRDLRPVTTLTAGAFMLVTSPHFPPNTVAELVAYAKAHPDRTNYGSYGNNTTNHLYGEELNYAAGMRATHVAYRGGAPAWNDLMAGQVQYMFENAALAMPMVRAGKLKALAMLTPERNHLAQDVPTMAEAGYPSIGMPSWLGLFAPARTPLAVVQRLHDEVAAVLASPELAQRLAERGTPTSVSTPEEFSRMLRSEIDAWKSLVQRVGLKLE